LAQSITDGAIVVSDTNVPFAFDDGTNWMDAYCTITSSTQITITQIISGSNGTSAVTFSGALPTVYNTVPGDFLRKVVVTTDGIAVTDLTVFSGTPSDSCVFPIQDPSTGLTYKITVGALRTLFGSGTPSQTITVNTPSAQTAGTPFSVSGSYANGTPTALDWSIDGGTTWNVAASPTIGGGTFSFGSVTVPSANVSQNVKVRDHTTSVVGTSGTFVVNAAEAITVNTPSTQTVGTPFTVLGGYTNGTPTALDYRLSDDSANQWTQVASPTISQGSFSFQITPTSTSGGRTISVRDRNNTAVVGTSGTYAVNAAGATVTSVVVSPATATVSGGQTQQFSATVNGTNSPSQAVTWSVLSGGGSINSSGLYTAPAATASSQTITVKALSVQDGTTSGTATVTVPAVTQSITVTTPGTQTVGTAYTLSGTWTSVQPSALDYQTTDNGGTPSSWTAASTGLIINGNGTWSFSVTPSGASTSRVISVRDHTTLVSGSSSAYVVNAAAAPVLSSPLGVSSGPTTAVGSVSTTSGNGTLYYLFSTNATETSATIAAANQTKAITTSGTQYVYGTGLVASTNYYAHFVHVDASAQTSNVANSGSFATPATDTTPTVTAASFTANSGSVTGTATTNKAGGTLYRYISTSYSETVTTVKASGTQSANNASGGQAFTFSGLNPLTTYYVYFVLVDAAGTTSSLSKSFYSTAPSAGTLMKDSYLLTSTNSGTGSFAAGTFGGTQPNGYCSSVTPRINVRTSTASAGAGAAANQSDIKFVWGKQGNPCPVAFTDTSIPANSGNGNNSASNTTTIQGANKYGSWADASSQYFGTYWPANSFNAYGTPGNYILWIMFSDGSSKAFDDNTGTPIVWVIS